MKKRIGFIRRGVSAFLSFVLLFSLFTFFPLISDAGAVTIPEVMGATGFDFTSNTYVAQKLSEIFELLPYSDYPYFTTYGYKTCGNSACTNCCVRDVSKKHPNLKDVGVVDDYSAYSCFGFARWAFLYIYGVQATGLNYQGNITSTSNLQRVGRVSSKKVSGFEGGYEAYTSANLKELYSQATPGDIIQARSDKNDSNHTMIFLGCDESGFYIIHNNAFKKRTDSKGNAYGYNRTLLTYYTFSDFMASYETYVSLLRAKQDVYEKVWSNDVPLCEGGEHTYTQESCGVCTVCGYKYKNQPSASSIGLYRAKEKSSVKSVPYGAGMTVTSIEAGGYAAVTSDVKNVFGELWYCTFDGKYVKADNFEKADASGGGTISFEMDKYPEKDIAYGKSFDLSGKINTSSGNVTEVYGAIVSSSDGSVRQKVSEKPGTQSFDIYSSDINYSLKFASLALGDYYYVVAAYTSKGDAAVFISPFSMTSSVRVKALTPMPPTLDKMTCRSVTLKSVDGIEYSKDAKKWQTSPVFEGLEPNTEYKFYARTAENAYYLASDASKALVVVTDYDPEVAPPVPTYESISPYGVVLTEDARLEFRMDGGAWQKSSTFSSLEAGSSHSFTCRIKSLGESALESEALTLTLPKADNTNVPSKPSVSLVTDTTITLVSIVGAEYSIDGGKNYQKSAFFDGLSPAKEYTFVARYAQTQTQNASGASATLRVTTLKSTRRAPEEGELRAEKIGAYDVTLGEIDGAEYRIDGGEWQESRVFDELSPRKKYLFEVRFKETAACYASDPIAIAVTTDKIMPSAPAAPVIISSGKDSVSLGVGDESAGEGAYEFSLNGGEWQTSPVFTGLPGYCELSFRVRISETELSHASVASESVTTVLVGGEIKADKKIGSYNAGTKTLGNVKTNTSISQLLDGVNAGKYIKVYTADGKKEITDKSLPAFTGMVCKVVLSNEDGSESCVSSFCVVTVGDVNGDGEITLADMIAVKAQTLSGGKADGVAGEAADVNGDGEVNIADFIIVKGVVLGKTSI